MEKKQDTQLNKLFLGEYKSFLKNYLFRLLGITTCDIEDCKTYENNPDCISRKDERIYFSAKGWQLYWVPDNPAFTDDNLRLAKVVIESFFQFSKYRVIGTGKYNRLMTQQRMHRLYNMAIQVGICTWIVGKTKSKKAERLFNILEQWSVKTYEGRNVTMGFIIDPTGISSAGIPFDDWMSFLEDDCSAVLSDCIHSVFELDKNCNFLGYRSITESGILPENPLNERVPLRFMQVVQQLIPKEPDNEKTNRVGIFLLANGDIILAKDGVTRFVKRNLQWLNLSYDAFRNSLNNFLHTMYVAPTPNDAEKLISSVYASILDVSFSHTGGIISIVGPEWERVIKKGSPVESILNPADNLLLSEDEINAKQAADLDNLPDDVMEEKMRDNEKRIIKRKILHNLVSGQKFPDLDRKLRSELIALDGACILKLDGSIYSFGAIIQNDSGSTGGGRSAAAKKLSKYGMAVKVSTDGYIELFVNSIPVYAVK